MLAGKEEGDEQTDDLVVAEGGVVLAVGHIHEHLQQVSTLTCVAAFLYFVTGNLQVLKKLFGGKLNDTSSSFDDFGEDRSHLLSRMVSHVVRWRWSVRKEERQRCNPFIQVMI